MARPPEPKPPEPKKWSPVESYAEAVKLRTARGIKTPAEIPKPPAAAPKRRGFFRRLLGL